MNRETNSVINGPKSDKLQSVEEPGGEIALSSVGQERDDGFA